MAAHTNNGKVQQSQPEVYEGVTISQFRNNTRTIYVEWFDKKLRVEYRPAVLDDEHFAALDADEKADETHRVWLNGYILRIVHSIPSLTLDDGSPFLITEGTVGLLPTALKNRIVGAIGLDLLPKETSESESSDSSSAAASEGASSPGGTPPSTAPSTSA